MSAAGEQAPSVFLHRESGRLVVPSRDLAVLTAHAHNAILKAVRRGSEDFDLTGEVFWSEYIDRRGHIRPCCHLTEAALVATFTRMHNVPDCRNIRAVLDAYLETMAEADADRQEPAEPAQVPPPAAANAAAKGLYQTWTERFRATVAAEQKPAEPAPDTAIAPPDPEPADTLEPAAPASWEINYAINILQRSDQPEHLKRVNKVWNDKRLEALFAEAKSWTEAEELYATEKPKREKAR